MTSTIGFRPEDRDQIIQEFPMDADLLELDSSRRAYCGLLAW
jgi:hypothetical protein